MKELSTTYCWNYFTVGEFKIQITFKSPRILEIDGLSHEAAGIIFCAQRAYIQKKKWVRVRGDAFVDWKAGSLSLPPGGTLESEELNSDFVGWEDWDGDLDEAKGGFETPVFNIYPINPTTDVIDLNEL